MKRVLSLVAAVGLILGAMVFALQPMAGFPYLDWAKKAPAAKAVTAVLLEFGHKDLASRDWSGSATVTGARVVRWEGYRFRAEDKLPHPGGWEASSRLPIRAPKGMPAVTKLESLATVGVILHIEDIKPDAKITIALKNGDTADVPLAEVVAGKTHPLWKGNAVARLLTSATPVAVSGAEEDHPAAAYGPDGTLWVAYIAYTHRDPSRRIESLPLKEQPKNFQSLYKPEFADQLFVRSYKNGAWSKPIAVTGEKEDLARCAVAASKQGDVWIVYSAHRKGNFDLYARKIDAQGKLEAEQRLTTQGGAELTPAMTTDTQGNVWLAAQSWDDKGQAGIAVMQAVNGVWSPIARIAGQPGENAWHPAIAVAPNGTVAVAYDLYHHGNYDIRVALFDGKAKAPTTVAIASTPKFEARPAIVYDTNSRLWVAYDEGPEKWGKDYGAQAPNKGYPLYNERSVRVVCLDADGALKRITAELPTSRIEPPVLPFDAIKTSKYEKATRYNFAKLGLDGQGRVWLAYRQSFGNRNSSHTGTCWQSFARRLDGQQWSEPIEITHSDGLQDSRPVLLPHAGGGLLIVHNTDGRFTTPTQIDNQIYVSTVNLPAKATALQLLPHSSGENPLTNAVAAENADVKRMKTHRLQNDGKTYQYLRGEYHRHTEISWDGGPDGSLEDMFRYAIDAAQMDWIGNGDHDNGAGREYTWWLIQKFSDAYRSASFTTMFTYERSVAYPHGHRNVMFAQRGILTLPRLASPAGKKKAEGGVHPDDAKMLYKYLHEFDGICASHTSATSMGTDWRDNDPVVEPIVELYQGDRMSYESEGVSRAGYDPQSGVLPANVAGWYPKGYINLALKKGYKLGFEASSDHWSTHISYFVILAEGRDRQNLLKAVKQRHCYAATDNILVDFRCGDRIMGDELTAAQAPKLQMHLIGTGAFAKIDVLRDSEVVQTFKPAGTEFKGEWTDPNPLAGIHYYYVRAQQSNGEMAWASPIWVTLKK